MLTFALAHSLRSKRSAGNGASDGAKGTASDVYVLDTGEAGAARLRLVDKVFGPSTRALLKQAGIAEGMRALDLACGIGTVSCWMAHQVGPTGKVLAAHVNPDQIVVSKSNCASCEHSSIEYVEISAYETGFPDDSFDLVHIRLLLCHLAEPEKALHEVYRVLKPGGVLVCQDLHLSGIFSFPEDAAYIRSLEIANKLGTHLGVNYNFGLRLPAAAEYAGFHSPFIRLEHPAYLRGEEKRLWEHTFAEAVPVILSSGVATEQELKQVLTGMRTVAADGRTLIAQWCSPGIIAVK